MALFASSRLQTAMRMVLILSAAGLAAMFLYSAALRVVWPYEIKWMEGGVADHVLRILEGGSLYQEPSWEFTTLLYMPLYYYASAALAYLTDSAFMGMRLVSLLAALITSLLLGVIVRRESGSLFAAWVAGLFYLGAWKASGFYLDIGRVDPLFLALFLGYVCLARYTDTTSGQLAAAVVATLCFFTKQTAAVACAPVAIYLFFTMDNWRRYIVPVAGAVLTLATLFTLSRLTDGWFEYFAFELAREHRYQWPKLPSLLIDELLLTYPFLIALGFVALVRVSESRRPEQIFVWLLFAALLVATFLPYMHTGSAPNALMPLQLGAALLLGVLLGLAQKDALAPGAGVLAILQCLWMTYLPGKVLPEPATGERARLLVDCMQRLPQPVLNTRTAYLWRLAGTNMTAHETPVADVFRTGESEVKDALMADFLERAGRQEYSALFFGPQLSKELGPLIESGYVLAGYNFSPQSAAGSYMLSNVYVSRDYLGGRELAGDSFCEGDGFFAVDADTPQIANP